MLMLLASASLLIKEVRGGVVHYNYLCELSDPICSCPKGEECVEAYPINEAFKGGDAGLMREWDTVCEEIVIGDDTWVQCYIVVPGGGDGGGYGGGDGGNHDDSDRGDGSYPSPKCLDRTIYEKWIGGYRIGLYFRDPDNRDSTLPVVLLVHGMGAQCNRWNNTFGKWFPQNNYRVAAVNLFPQNMDAPSEAWGWMFHPNGTQMSELIDTLHAYLERNYPGWNNKIIAVAHSRGGLEVEDVIYIRNNRYIDGVVTIGTPFYGTPLADMGVRICEDMLDAVTICAPLLFTKYAAMYLPCVGAVELVEELLCDDFPSDMYILTSPAVNNWRRVVRLRDKISSNPITFNVGVGWTPALGCGPFPSNTQAGCILMRYAARAGCNDGAVPLYGARRRYVDNPSATKIFSKWPDSYAPGCEGDPEEWEKDHTESVESYDIYLDVESSVQAINSSSYIASFPEGPVPFATPKSIPDDDPVVVYSRSFITAVDSNTLTLSLSPGEDSVLIWSSQPVILGYTTAADSQRLKGGRMYTVFPHVPVLSMRVNNPRDESESVESATTTPVFVIFADGDPLYVKLNKSTYLQNELIYIKAHYPGLDTIMAAFINVSSPYRTYPVDFVNHGDTLVAITSLPDEGVYKLFVYAARRNTNGAVESPRLAIATIVVVGDVDMDRVVGVLTGRYPEKTDDNPSGNMRKGNFPPYFRNALRVDWAEGKYTIYNVAGYRVRTGRFKNYTIPLTGLKRGVYFVKVGSKVYKVVR